MTPLSDPVLVAKLSVMAEAAGYVGVAANARIARSEITMLCSGEEDLIRRIATTWAAMDHVIDALHLSRAIISRVATVEFNRLHDRFSEI